MINLELILNHLKLNGLNIDWSEGREPKLDNLIDPLEFRIGYSSIETITDKGIPLGDLELIDEDNIQIFETKIICLQSELHSAWKLLNGNLKTFQALPNQGQYSSINHVEGAVIGADKKICHLDRWKILVNN